MSSELYLWFHIRFFQVLWFLLKQCVQPCYPVSLIPCYQMYDYALIPRFYPLPLYPGKSTLVRSQTCNRFCSPYLVLETLSIGFIPSMKHVTSHRRSCKVVPILLSTETVHVGMILLVVCENNSSSGVIAIYRHKLSPSCQIGRLCRFWKSSTTVIEYLSFSDNNMSLRIVTYPAIMVCIV